MDIAKLVEKIRKSGASKVYVQVPEGLKTRVLGIAKELEASGIETIIGCDTVYGACDLRDKEAKLLGCDLLLHIGHTDFGVKACLPVLYEAYEIAYDPVPLLRKHLPALKEKRISLLTTIQFSKALKPAAAFLRNADKEVIFSKQLRNSKEGILLGCDWTAALPLQDKVDCFVYIGSGKFHPLGLARKVSKPVYWIDFESGELVSMEKEKLRLDKVKAFHLEEAKEAMDFGILVSTKAGQMFFSRAEAIKKLLESKGKRAFVLVMDEISPQKIMGMKLDVLINCACPRMDEDFSLFKKPILNPEDVEKM